MTLRENVALVTDQLEAAGAGLGGPVEEATGRLTVLLEPALRLAIQNTLVEAAHDLDTQLDGVARIDVRLTGEEASLVATLETTGVAPTSTFDVSEATPGTPWGTHVDSDASPEADGPDGEGGDGGVSGGPATRFTLRVPESLKARVDDAAAAQGVSVNAWFVRAAERSLASGVQGWARVVADEVEAALDASGVRFDGPPATRTHPPQRSGRRMTGWLG